MKQEVWLGDCLELMKNIPDNSIDAIICDLPYGTTKCKWDVIIPFEKLWENYLRIKKTNSAIVLFGTEPFSSYLRLSNIKMFKYDWIWDKVTARGHLVAKKRPMAQHENISVFYDKKATYNPQMIERPKDKIRVSKRTEYKRTEICGGVSNSPRDIIYDKWYPKTIIVDSNANSSSKSVHPTQKPVSLCEYLIKTYTNEGDLVLDNCAGSGSTLVAAKNLNRQFIGIEKEEKYYNICLERLKNAN